MLGNYLGYRNEKVWIDGSTYKIGERDRVFYLTEGKWVLSSKHPTEVVKEIEKKRNPKKPKKTGRKPREEVI